MKIPWRRKRSESIFSNKSNKSTTSKVSISSIDEKKIAIDQVIDENLKESINEKQTEIKEENINKEEIYSLEENNSEAINQINNDILENNIEIKESLFSEGENQFNENENLKNDNNIEINKELINEHDKNLVKEIDKEINNVLTKDIDKMIQNEDKIKEESNHPIIHDISIEKEKNSSFTLINEKSQLKTSNNIKSLEKKFSSGSVFSNIESPSRSPEFKQPHPIYSIQREVEIKSGELYKATSNNNLRTPSPLYRRSSLLENNQEHSMSPKPVVSASKYVSKKMKKSLIQSDIPTTEIPQLHFAGIYNHSPKRKVNPNILNYSIKKSEQNLNNSPTRTNTPEKRKRSASIAKLEGSNFIEFDIQKDLFFSSSKSEGHRDSISEISDVDSRLSKDPVESNFPFESRYIHQITKSQDSGFGYNEYSENSRRSSFGSSKGKSMFTWEEVKPIFNDERSKKNPRVSALRQKFEPRIKVRQNLESEIFNSDEKHVKSFFSNDFQSSPSDEISFVDINNHHISSPLIQNNINLNLIEKQLLENEVYDSQMNDTQKSNQSELIKNSPKNHQTDLFQNSSLNAKPVLINQSTSISNSLNSTDSISIKQEKRIFIDAQVQSNLALNNQFLLNNETIISSYLKKNNKRLNPDKNQKNARDLLTKYRQALVDESKLNTKINNNYYHFEEKRKNTKFNNFDIFNSFNPINQHKSKQTNDSNYLDPLPQKAPMPEKAPTPLIDKSFDKSLSSNESKLDSIRNNIQNIVNSVNQRNNPTFNDNNSILNSAIKEDIKKFGDWELLVQQVDSDFIPPSKYYSISPKKDIAKSQMRNRAKQFIERFNKEKSGSKDQMKLNNIDKNLNKTKIQNKNIENQKLQQHGSSNLNKKNFIQNKPVIKLLNSNQIVKKNNFENIPDYLEELVEMQEEIDTQSLDLSSFDITSESIDYSDDSHEDSEFITALEDRLTRMRNRSKNLKTKQ